MAVYQICLHMLLLRPSWYRAERDLFLSQLRCHIMWKFSNTRISQFVTFQCYFNPFWLINNQFSQICLCPYWITILSTGYAGKEVIRVRHQITQIIQFFTSIGLIETSKYISLQMLSRIANWKYKRELLILFILFKFFSFCFFFWDRNKLEEIVSHSCGRTVWIWFLRRIVLMKGKRR